MPATVIQIERLSKMYRLGVINNGVLFRDINRCQAWKAVSVKAGLKNQRKNRFL